MHISNKKYETTGEVKSIAGIPVYRIRSKKNFGNIEKGQLGGWISGDDCLSETGTAWVADEAIVYRSKVKDQAQVSGCATVSWSQIYGHAKVCGNARVDNSKVYGRAVCEDHSSVAFSSIYGQARVAFGADIAGSTVRGDTEVIGLTTVRNSKIMSSYLEAGYFLEAGILSDDDSLVIQSIGSERGILSAYLGKDKTVRVTRGCFFGTLEEFSKAVNSKHGDSIHGREYRSAIELIKCRFEGRGVQL